MINERELLVGLSGCLLHLYFGVLQIQQQTLVYVEEVLFFQRQSRNRCTPNKVAHSNTH